MPEINGPGSWVGRPMPRREDEALLRGRATYVANMRRSGMVYMAVARSPGILVNPLLAEGQVHGSVAQGIAAALWEEMSYDEEGQPLTASFAEYGIPSAAELAGMEISSEFQVTPSPFNLLGAKGSGRAAPSASPPRSAMPLSTRSHRSGSITPICLIRPRRCGGCYVPQTTRSLCQAHYRCI